MSVPIPRAVALCLALAPLRPLAAQASLVRDLPVHMACGSSCLLPEPPPSVPPKTWQWSVRGDLGSGGPTLLPDHLVLKREPGGGWRFTAPRLLETRIFRIRITNVARPEEMGEAEVWIRPPWDDPVRFQGLRGPEPAVSGGCYPLRAERLTGVRKRWDWSLGEGRERLYGACLFDAREDGTVQFRPPVVGCRTTLALDVRDPSAPGPADGCRIEVHPRYPDPGIRFVWDPEELGPGGLPPGGSCLLDAVRDGGGPRTWRWSLVNGAGSLLVTEPCGRQRFLAPSFAPFAHRVRVRVENAGDPLEFAELPILVNPPYLFTTVLPGVRPEDWIPRLVLPFAGEFLAAPDVPGRLFEGLAGVAEADGAALGRTGACWVAYDDWGLHILDAFGRAARALAGASLAPRMGSASGSSRVRITAAASRPQDALPGNPFHLVFAASLLDGENRPRFTRLWDWDGVQEPRLLDPHPSDGEPGSPGPTGASPFGTLTGLALDRAGNLFLADARAGLILRMGPDLEVKVLACGARIAGAVLPFKAPPAGLALDPASGALYAAVGDRILKVDPGTGERTVLFGPGPRGRPAADPPLHTLDLGPDLDLAFSHGRLLAADRTRGCLWVLDPAQGTGAALVAAWNPSLEALTALPLGAAPPGLRIRGLCPGPQGSVLVAGPEHVHTLDWRWLRLEQLPATVPEPTSRPPEPGAGDRVPPFGPRVAAPPRGPGIEGGPGALPPGGTALLALAPAEADGDWEWRADLGNVEALDGGRARYTAPAGTGVPGVARITARSRRDPRRSASRLLTLLPR